MAVRDLPGRAAAAVDGEDLAGHERCINREIARGESDVMPLNDGSDPPNRFEPKSAK